MVNDVIEVGVTYDPIYDELYTAQRGQGAYLNGERLHVSAAPALDKALLVTGFPYDRRTNPNNNIRQFTDFSLRAQGVLRLGSAALDLGAVAAGRLDGYWEFKINPWDIAAGVFLVTEAGGQVTVPDGSPLDLFARQIVASNGLIQNEMIEVLADSQPWPDHLNATTPNACGLATTRVKPASCKRRTTPLVVRAPLLLSGSPM